MGDYYDQPIYCTECGRVIEYGEDYLQIGDDIVCEKCEDDYLKNYRHEVQYVLGR